MRAVDGGALGAVDGGGVAVVEVVGVELLAGEGDRVGGVVEAHGDRAVVVLDGGHGAALAGDEPAVGVGREGDDAVTFGVAATAGCFDAGLAERAGGAPTHAGEVVELGDVVAAPGDHDRVVADVEVGLPCRRRGQQGVPAVGVLADAAVVGVPGHGDGRVARAELFERSALVEVPLADVLVQGVDGVGIAGEQGFEAAAGADGAELVVVADHDHLGPVQLRGREQSQHGVVVQHPGFIDDEDGPVVEGLVAVAEAPQQRRTGAGIEVGGIAEGTGSLAGGGGAEHSVAIGFEGVAEGIEGGGLARPGDAEDQFELPTRRRRPLDELALAGGESGVECPLLLADRKLGRGRIHGHGDRRRRETLGALGDGFLSGSRGGQHPEPVPGSGLPQQRQRLRMGHHGTEGTGELVRVPAVQSRREVADDLGAPEPLLAGQRPVG